VESLFLFHVLNFQTGTITGPNNEELNKAFSNKNIVNKLRSMSNGLILVRRAHHRFFVVRQELISLTPPRPLPGSLFDHIGPREEDIPFFIA
jgi:hypothetical protein